MKNIFNKILSVDKGVLKMTPFKCVTALNTEVTIHLCFGDEIDFLSEIWITEGEETKRYITNNNFEKGKTVPKVTLL